MPNCTYVWYIPYIMIVVSNKKGKKWDVVCDQYHSAQCTLFYTAWFFSSSDNSTINLIEVAHQKPAEQSSNYKDAYPASRAVDGNLNTHVHTNREQSPYWIVDLGKNYQIKRIEIFNVNTENKSTGGWMYLQYECSSCHV